MEGGGKGGTCISIYTYKAYSLQPPTPSVWVRVSRVAGGRSPGEAKGLNINDYILKEGPPPPIIL